MQEKQRIQQELDAAIDRMDMDAIDRGLSALSEMEPKEIAAEDPRLFSARIQKQYKEKHEMKNTKRYTKYAIVAAVVMAMGVTVYAASPFSRFAFQFGDQLITLRTNESIDEAGARELVEDGLNADIAEGMEGQAAAPDIESFDFSSTEQAQRELDMVIPMPAAMPDMELESASGQLARYGDSLTTKLCWLNYEDPQGRMLGITVTREEVAPGESVTGYTAHDIDDGSLGAYTSATGTVFTTLTESDDTGEKTAHIATATVGEYEYALVFFGFDEAEQHQIIDSVDLTVYQG